MKIMLRGRKPSIQSKLILPMLLAALIPMTVFAWMVRQAINNSNFNAGRTEADKLAKTISGEIAALEDNASAAAQTIANSTVVRNAYRALMEGVSEADELDYYTLLRNTITMTSLLDDFYGIRMYLPESKLLTREGYNFYSFASLNADELPEAMRSSKTRLGWTDWRMTDGKNQHTPTLCKSYWVVTPLKGKGGGDLFVAVDISMASLQRIMLRHGEIVCEYVLYDANGEELSRCGAAEDVPKERLHVSQEKLNDGTVLCIEVDLVQFRSDISDYLTLLLYISIACMVLVPFGSVAVLNRQCRDLAELAAANVQMAEGEYRLIPENANTREVLTIQQTHNNMVMRIDDLIHNVYEEKIEKQEAQLNCLFEQIKPHFLYNTLESGKWMAVRAEDLRTAKFLEKLAKYFRAGLGNGAEQVPLRSELQHIQLYIELINMRIADCVQLEIHAEEEVLDCQVMRLLLQPIVENAVEHGICARVHPHGIVTIHAWRKVQTLTIQVENDGVRMSEKQLEALNTGIEIGLGISNVRKRMELFYGDAGSISFENREIEGVRTTIEIKNCL